jgi:PAS domain S-box-containing protein
MAASSRKRGRTSDAQAAFTPAILGGMVARPVSVDVHDLIQTTLLGEAVENAPVAVFVADDEMRFIAVNRAACALLGYERDELLALRASDVSRIPSIEERFHELMARGESAGRRTLVRKDGSTVEIEFWATSTKVAQMTVYVAFVKALADAV